MEQLLMADLFHPVEVCGFDIANINGYSVYDILLFFLVSQKL